MRDLFTVIKFTMKDMLSRKSFIISTIIILVLIVIGFNIPNIISSFDEDIFMDKILVIDRDNIYEGKIPELENLELSNDSNEEIEEKILNGEINSAIFIYPTEDGSPHLHYLTKNMTTANEMPELLFAAFSFTYIDNQIAKLNLPPKEANQIHPSFQVTTSHVEEQEIHGNIFVMMLLSVILFYAIYFCAFQVSSSITTEKTSKIIETLVTSTSPRNIILGKTIGIGIVGLLQMALFVIVALISAFTFINPGLLAQVLDLSTLTPFLGLVLVIYFLLGYFAYALLYALTGSTVSKPEDIQSANAPIAILALVGFYLAFFTLQDPTSDLNTFAAFFPISSPFCMPIRVMMGIASPLEIGLSILILIATILVIAHIAIKIYSTAILNYGTKTNILSFFKKPRTKEEKHE